MIAMREGRHEQAVASYRQTIALETELHGGAHRAVWNAKNNLAKALLAVGRTPEAIEIYRGRLGWAIDRYGNGHAEVTTAGINLANAQLTHANDEAELQQVLEVIEPTIAVLRRDDPVLPNALAIKARALQRLGRLAAAVNVYRDALAIERAATDPREALVAYLGSEYAQVLWGAGRRRAALDEAKAALVLYETVPGKATKVAELAAWIAERERR